MTNAHLLLQRALAVLRLARPRAVALLSSRTLQPTAMVSPAALIMRRPSRRMVTELTSLLAISPVVLGLSALVALPWPEKITTPAPRPSAYGALASLASSSGSTAPARLGTAAKFTDRAPATELRRAPDSQQAAAPAPVIGKIVGEPGRAVIAEDGDLIIDGERVRLDGIVMPEADAACRRLDGAEVRCLERVVARMSILVQHGPLTCRTKLDATGGRIGKCVAGKIDMAQDLVRAQLARSF